MKKCKTCGKDKPYSSFSKAATCKDGHRGSCKSCRNPASNAYNKEHRQKNIQKARENARLYYAANRDKILEDRKRYYHQEGWLKKYQAKANIKYKKRVRQATPRWLSDDHLFAIEEVYSLRNLRSQITGVPHHVDHIVPLKGKDVCGLHVPWNLQLLTAYENQSKGNKH